MAITDRVTTMVLPLLEPLGLHLYDVEVNGATLRITVDAEGGVNLDQLASATRAVSRLFDEDDPMPGGYTLEVSSPGLERKLRLPHHFRGAVGEQVNVKLGPHVEGDRRVRGSLDAVSDDAITVADDDGNERRIEIADITKAVTVFEWGPSPRPGSPGAGSSKANKRSQSPDQAPSVGSTSAAAAGSATASPDDATTEDGQGTATPSDSERRAPAQ